MESSRKLKGSKSSPKRKQSKSRGGRKRGGTVSSKVAQQTPAPLPPLLPLIGGGEMGHSGLDPSDHDHDHDLDHGDEEQEEERVEVSPHPIHLPSNSNEDSSEIRLHQLITASRTKQQSFWDTVCNEIDGELSEVDLILGRLGLPPYNYRKDKIFPLPPHPNSKRCDGTSIKRDNCISRVYLDTFVFPYLLPAIHDMLDHVTLSSLHLTTNPFNPLDFITQHLYIQNPKYPERKLNLPTPPFPINEIPWARTWINKYPRPGPPKWLTMTMEEAARIIQAGVRIWLARRKRHQLQEQKQKTKLKEGKIKDEECGDERALCPGGTQSQLQSRHPMGDG